MLIARPYVFRENLRLISREPLWRGKVERLLLRKIDYTFYVRGG